MCGICGFAALHPAPEARAILQRMNDALRHRGPDDEGSLQSGALAFAMRRLAIIDLSTGHQPISTSDGQSHIVYNGELYNFKDIRGALEALGWRFRTQSDTEVILYAYRQWGPASLERLNGMFALAIADGERLFIARDRFGEKPLYYFHDAAAGLLVYGSEIKALFQHPGVPRVVNHAALPEYLTHGYVPAPQTMFAGILELPPAHYLLWEGGRIQVRRYWDWAPAFEHQRAMDEGEAAAEVQRRLAASVRARLISDVPLGAFLSGGVDSAAVVACMAQASSRPVQTFSLGFAGDATYDETAVARLTARRYATDHHEFIVEPRALELLPTLVRHHDQPFGDSSAIPTHLISQLARQHVTVALTGDGGDELFAGYRRFAAAGLAETYQRLPRPLRRALAAAAARLPEPTTYNNLPGRLRRFTAAADAPLAQRYLAWVGLFTGDLLQRLIADAACDSRAVPAAFQAQFAAVARCAPLDQLLYVNAATYLPGDLLVKSDRMSMANSLELRAPFLDHELAEFVAGLPAGMKLRGLGTKRLLKRAVRGLVPAAVLTRPKQGFAVPIGGWFRRELRGYLPEILLAPEARARPYFHSPVVAQLIEEHQSGRRDHAHRLWALLTFELWHREYIDHAGG
jgi:asparagine synthase (glutamine-hydrolysing)